MTPDTVHLIAQLIRHQRGIMTAIEKWAGKQEPSRTNLEVIAATTLMREVLASYEAELVRVDVQDDKACVLVTGE